MSNLPAPYVPQNATTVDIITGGGLSGFVEFAKVMAAAGALPQGVSGNPANLLYLVMAGIDAGFRPMQALELYDMIQGKPALSAEGKRVAMLRDGHEFETVEESATSCTVRGRRRGSQTWHTASYTLDEAKKAGLIKPGSNWDKHPSDMLFARATARLCRRYFPDVAAGVATIEDLQDSRAATAKRPDMAAVAAQREQQSPAPVDEEHLRREVAAIAEEQRADHDGVIGEDPPAELWPAVAQPGADR
jgi:hypothetical protein